MILSPDSGQPGLSLQFVEGTLTLAGMLLAFGLPRICDRQFRVVERGFAAVARRRGLSVLIVGLSAIVLRLAMLPLMPVPLPFIHDDFSMLLAADTFLHGRLANPTPAMWVHFETVHETMLPTYASMYFPGAGLVLAGGKLVFGDPWFGLLIATGLMCAAICWMLQAWLPPEWALLGGFLCVLRLGLFSYWMDTYTGGGSIAALGGALILGALPRFLRTERARSLWLIAIGAVLVAFTRPYEGMLLCLPVAFVMARWVFAKSNPLPKTTLIGMAAGPLLLLIASLAWLGFYDYRAFGSVITLPYTVDRATYAIAPYFVWERARREPHYRHPHMKEFYESELTGYDATRSLSGAVVEHFQLGAVWLNFYCGLALLPLLVLMPRALFDRRIRFLSIALLILIFGMSIEIFGIPHYVAPFTGALYAAGLQSARHLSHWRLNDLRIGRAIVRMCILVCLVMAGIRPFNRFLGLPVARWPSKETLTEWYGPDHFGVKRKSVEQKLEELQGNQLALVRYSHHSPALIEWVYNGADIDGQKVIWADDMEPSGNQELIDHYKDRKVWLVQPDSDPVSVTPYPTGALNAAAPLPRSPLHP